MKYYLIGLLLFQPIEELYTCNHPNLIGKQNIHLLCNWDRDDFYISVSGDLILRPKRKKDNLAKAYYREKYWKNVKNRKI